MFVHSTCWSGSGRSACCWIETVCLSRICSFFRLRNWDNTYRGSSVHSTDCWIYTIPAKEARFVLPIVESSNCACQGSSVCSAYCRIKTVLAKKALFVLFFVELRHKTCQESLVRSVRGCIETQYLQIKLDSFCLWMNWDTIPGQYVLHVADSRHNTCQEDFVCSSCCWIETIPAKKAWFVCSLLDRDTIPAVIGIVILVIHPLYYDLFCWEGLWCCSWVDCLAL